MGKKKPKISVNPQSLVTATPISNKSNRFAISYQYLCTDNKKYSMELLGSNKDIIKYYDDFNTKMREYSQHDNFKKFINEERRYRDKNHIHPINWNDSRIRETCFTSLNSDLMEQVKEECWQLGVNNQGFRIHGFFIENVFYIIWLDPCHNLYHMK